jgi:hypothetical protein
MCGTKENFMALEVKIPDEINDYEGKLVAGMSTRQVLSVLGAIAVGLPIVLLGKGHISADVLPWFVIIAVVPFAGWGFFKYEGMKFEEFVRVFFGYMFLNPRRAYEDTENNIFIKMNESLLEKEIVRQLIDTGRFDEDDIESIKELYNV